LILEFVPNAEEGNPNPTPLCGPDCGVTVGELIIGIKGEGNPGVCGAFNVPGDVP
jgi:hypothetical protein